MDCINLLICNQLSNMVTNESAIPLMWRIYLEIGQEFYFIFLYILAMNEVDTFLLRVGSSNTYIYIIMFNFVQKTILIVVQHLLRAILQNWKEDSN